MTQELAVLVAARNRALVPYRFVTRAQLGMTRLPISSPGQRTVRIGRIIGTRAAVDGQVAVKFGRSSAVGAHIYQPL